MIHAGRNEGKNSQNSTPAVKVRQISMALLMIPDKIQLSRRKRMKSRGAEGRDATGSRRIQRVSQFAEKGSIGGSLGIMDRSWGRKIELQA